MNTRATCPRFLRSILLLSVLATCLLCQLSKADHKLTDEELFTKYEGLMKKQKKWSSLTANEKRFRFNIFKKNLKQIHKVVPPPKDKHGRPLLGLTAAIYRKGINKFVFLSEDEFKNSFLMKKNVLYVENKFQSQALEQRLSFDNFLEKQSGNQSQSQSQNQNGMGRGVGGQVDSLPGLENEIARFNDTSEELEEDMDNILSIFDDAELALGNSRPRSLNTPQNSVLTGPQSTNRFRISNSQPRILQQSVVPGLKNQVDWVHLFNPVFDQIDCNSCYAAAAVGAIEAMHKKVYPDSPKINLSKQEILDCSKENFHCMGGQPSSVMGYVKDYGISYSSSYPYKGKKQFCQARYFDNKMRKRSAARILESLMSIAGEGSASEIHPRVLQQSRYGQYQYSNVSSNPNQARFGQATQRVPVRSGFPQQTNQFGQRTNQFTPNQNTRYNTNQFQQNTPQQTNRYPTQRSGFQTAPQRTGFQTTPQRNGYQPQPQQTTQNQFNRGFNYNTFSQPQRKPQKEVQYDRPRRLYYVKVTNFIGNTPQVSYQDMQGRAYTPSFQVQNRQLPHVHVKPQTPDQNSKNETKKGDSKEEKLETLENEKDKKAGQDKTDGGLAELNELSELPKKKTEDSSKSDELEVLEEIPKNETKRQRRKRERRERRKKREEARKKREEEERKDNEAEQREIQREEDEKKQRAEEERIAKLEKDKKIAEEEAKKAKEAEEEAKKVEEEAKKADEEVKKAQEAEQKRIEAQELERKRLEDEQEAERQRQDAQEAEIQRIETERQRLAAAQEAERKRKEAQIQTKDQFTIKGPRYEELKGYYFIRKNVMDVLKALQYGPVVTAHFVSEPFKFYESGVFDGDGCEDGSLDYVNHASVIVGYDLEAPVPYFKMRNSWADDWGENGYYRMKIGELSKQNSGICLIAGTPFMVFPYLEKKA